MKALIMLVVIIFVFLGLVALGWVYVRSDRDQVEVIIDKAKVQSDSQRVIDESLPRGREFLEEATDGLERMGDRLDAGVDVEPDPNDGAQSATATSGQLASGWLATVLERP